MNCAENIEVVAAGKAILRDLEQWSERIKAGQYDEMTVRVLRYLEEESRELLALAHAKGSSKWVNNAKGFIREAKALTERVGSDSRPAT